MTKFRSKKHLKFVGSFSCLVCDSPPQSDAHHITYSEQSGMGLKVGDQNTVPLCRKCHTELHVSGMSEELWWSLKGIDPIEHAERIYKDGQENTTTSI
jgi:hypothetical protein